MKKVISKIVLFAFITQTIFSPLAAAELSLPQFPLQITKYVEPNVMLLLDTSGSMNTFETISPGVTQRRINIIKEIASNLVQTNKNIRFCLARFRYDQGGTVLSECGSSVENINNIVNKINSLPASGSTPLAEAYYEVINYFAGKSPKYANGSGDHTNNDDNIYVPLLGGKYQSPVQYRCQKNYAIVMTDGTPQLDTYFPAFPNSSAANKSYNVRSPYNNLTGKDGNYDGKNSGIHFDGNDATNWGVYYFLDDMAKYAWDLDLRQSGIDNAANDLTGKSFDDSTNSSEFAKQNLNTYTVGFILDIPMLQHAADYGKGGTGNGDFDGDGDVDATDAANDHYYQANNKAELVQAFQDAIDQIAIENRSTAAPTSNSDLLSDDLKLYQTRFTNNEWTGELLSYDIVQNSTGSYDIVEDWVAPSGFPASWQNRVIDTGLDGGEALKWNNLTDAEKTAWFGGKTNTHKQRLNYIRGKTAAQIGGSNYRARASLMGDIINSDAIFVGPPTAKEFYNEPVGSNIASSHASFVSTYNSSTSPRNEMIYVGANDGMLHGFDAAGNEKMAFVPSKVFPNLLELSQNDYSHLFYVDGSPTSEDVYAKFDGSNYSWRTILVGGLRRGGQGIYALDITDPSRFVNGDDSADNTRASTLLQWEFSDDTTKGALVHNDKYIGDKELGYTYSKPQIMRLNDGEYYVAVGNGYNNTEADGHQSTTGEAVLYLLNIATGAIVQKISTGYGMSKDPRGTLIANGLGTIKGYDAGTLSNGEISGQADGKIDYIYAGDLFGNIWKFDLANTDPNEWIYKSELDGSSLNVHRNPIKLFTAKDKDGVEQPVTVQPEVHTLNSGEIMVYFGTGKLLEHKDTQAANISPQTFYAIVDKSDEVNPDVNPKIQSRTNLLQQTITFQDHVSFGGITKEIRTVSEHVREPHHKGWYLDLAKPVVDGSNNLTYQQEGEQIVVAARVLDNILYFVTNFSDQDACVPPVKKNFLMTLSVRSGAAFKTGEEKNEAIIDTNEDGHIDINDNITQVDADGNSTTSSVSGRTGFGTQLPIIINSGTSNEGAKEGLICDSSKCYKMKSPDKIWKRLSWKEIKTD